MSRIQVQFAGGWLVTVYTCLLGWLVAVYTCLLGWLVTVYTCVLGWLVTVYTCVLGWLVTVYTGLLGWLVAVYTCLLGCKSSICYFVSIRRINKTIVISNSCVVHVVSPLFSVFFASDN